MGVSFSGDVARWASERSGQHVPTWAIGYLFERNLVPCTDECPVVRGRRLIPDSCREVIYAALIRLGKVPSHHHVQS
jgi:hypothetical protein